MKPVKYTLPAYWASYLVNGDASGIDEHNKKAADEFLTKNELPSPVSCGDETWFAKSNDAFTLGCEVMSYDFLVEERLTPEQVASAKRTCERFNVPFVPSEWVEAIGCDGGVTRGFNGALGPIWILIEKDGYAHS